MNQKKNLSRITLDIPSEDHKRLKAIAAITGKSMRELMLEALKEYFKDTKTTLSEIKESL